MNNLRSKLRIFFKMLICASLSSIQISSAFESKSTMVANASEAFLGIESVGSDSYRILNLKRTV